MWIRAQDGTIVNARQVAVFGWEPQDPDAFPPRAFLVTGSLAVLDPEEDDRLATVVLATDCPAAEKDFLLDAIARALALGQGFLEIEGVRAARAHAECARAGAGGDPGAPARPRNLCDPPPGLGRGFRRP